MLLTTLVVVFDFTVNPFLFEFKLFVLLLEHLRGRAVVLS